MTAESSLLLGAASAFSWFVGLAVQLAFLIVIAVVVRKHRPDAWPILCGALAFELVVTTFGYASNIILPRLAVSAGGMHGYALGQAIASTIFAGAHAAARALLLWGIVKLARPAEAG